MLKFRLVELQLNSQEVRVEGWFSEKYGVNRKKFFFFSTSALYVQDCDNK